MDTRKPRVVYWFDIPTPTPIARCNAVADTGELDFEVWFNRRSHTMDHQKWSVDEAGFRFPYRYVSGIEVLGRRFSIPLAEMATSHPDVIVQDYWPSWMALGTLGSKRYARRTALRVLPNYDAWSTRTRFGELAKSFIFRAVDGAKVPGPDGRALATRYGLPAERTAVVHQTVDAAPYAALRDLPTDERDERRAALGLTGCTFIYVGRIWEGKGLDHLFAAYREVARQRLDGVSLLLLGDGPDDAKYRALAADLPNVVFAGWIAERETPQYFALSDVLVFPTLGDPHGLVVEEAMSAGVPVICSDSAGDIRLRIHDGENGFVVPTGDAQALADRMLRLADDAELRKRFRDGGIATVARLPHSVYGADFVAFARRVLDLPPRRTPWALAARLGGALLRLVSRRSEPLVQPNPTGEAPIP